jgi:ribulose bisphosphate carboxylase small subunit
MSFLETLRGAPATEPEIPFGVMLRRISDDHANPPLAALQHFLTDNRDRFVRVPVVDG